MMRRASVVDVSTAERWRAAAIEQSTRFGVAVLKEDPDQYPRLVADAEAMTSKLGLDPSEQQELFVSIRQRYAAAARNGKPPKAASAR